MHYTQVKSEVQSLRTSNTVSDLSGALILWTVCRSVCTHKLI